VLRDLPGVVRPDEVVVLPGHQEGRHEAPGNQHKGGGKAKARPWVGCTLAQLNLLGE
jgi:hypothetical protein